MESSYFTLKQKDGFTYVYVFTVNGVKGNTSSPTTSINDFSYSGGSQTIGVKSYIEVRVGSSTGEIDHYEAAHWNAENSSWTTVSPLSGNGTTTDSETSVSITASAQQEASYDNRRCSDMTFTQVDSGNKVIVSACQEKNTTGYTYTFYTNNDSLSFGACSTSSNNITVYSYKDKTRNGIPISGNRTNIGYSVNTSPWATATSSSNPSSSATTSTITADSNSNNTSSRSSYFQYTQSESNNTFRVDISQDGATCQSYGIGQLQLNIGNGFKTNETYSVSSDGGTINVSFKSPRYMSLCGISTNTKCDDEIENYKIKSIPSWMHSNLTNYSTGNDIISIDSKNDAGSRSGTIIYTNNYYDAQITVTQEGAFEYTSIDYTLRSYDGVGYVECMGNELELNRTYSTSLEGELIDITVYQGGSFSIEFGSVLSEIRDDGEWNGTFTYSANVFSVPDGSNGHLTGVISDNGSQYEITIEVVS